MNPPLSRAQQIHDDLNFVVIALLSGAISLREFRRWISRIIERTPADDLPEILFDLMEINDQIVMQRARGLSIQNAVRELIPGNSPLRALTALAYLRDPALCAQRYPELTTLKARAELSRHPVVLARFEALFPTIVLPLPRNFP